MGDVIPLSDLASWLAPFRQQGKRIVVTNGCFDILHIGHLRYLTEAKALGDLLVVGLNGDASVRALKGDDRPVNTEADRAELLAGLAVVDAVSIFPEVRALAFFEAARPDIYVKGGDYTREQLNREERELLESMGSDIRLLPMVKGYSSSHLIPHVRKGQSSGT